MGAAFFDINDHRPLSRIGRILADSDSLNRTVPEKLLPVRFFGVQGAAEAGSK